MNKATRDLWHAVRRADLEGNPDEYEWWEFRDRHEWRVLVVMFEWHAAGSARNIRVALRRLSTGMPYYGVFDFPGAGVGDD